MKTSILLVLLNIGIFNITQNSNIQNVPVFITNTNIEELAELFLPSVDLSILTESEVYSKIQAKMMLSEFFNSKKIQGFELEHDGYSGTSSYYAIGKLKSSNQDFRVTYLMTKDNVSFKIKHFTIESFEGK